MLDRVSQRHAERTAGPRLRWWLAWACAGFRVLLLLC
jgi:hypothetical protein